MNQAEGVKSVASPRVRPAFRWLVWMTLGTLAVAGVVVNWRAVVALPLALFAEVSAWVAAHWLLILLLAAALFAMRLKFMVREYLEESLAIQRRQLGKLNQLIRYTRGIAAKLQKTEDSRPDRD